jgi:hypothetical protein
VRQSKLYRQYESGNQIKDLLGQGGLKWDENKKQGAYAGHEVFDHNKCQLGAPKARSYGKRSEGVVTKSPNGTRLTKGDYGYGVPMVAKPQETFSAVPWGTDPISQSAAPAAAAAPPAPQDDYYGQGQQQAQQGSPYYQQDAYAQSPYQNEGARGGYYPPPQHASEGGSSYPMGQQQQQQHSYVQQPADGYHAPAASNGYYDEHKYQRGAAASVHSHPHSHQPSPAAPAASFGRRSAQRVEVILKEGQVDHEFGNTVAPSLLQTRPW